MDEFFRLHSKFTTQKTHTFFLQMCKKSQFCMENKKKKKINNDKRTHMYRV